MKTREEIEIDLEKTRRSIRITKMAIADIASDCLLDTHNTLVILMEHLITLESQEATLKWVLDKEEE